MAEDEAQSSKDEQQSKDEADDKKEADKQDKENDQQRSRARPFVRLGLIAIIVAFVGGGVFLYLTTRGKQTTDDAYTAGRTINIAPQVSGYIVELDVNDNQFVHQGEVLARIDPRNYQAALDGAQAAVVQAQGWPRASCASRKARSSRPKPTTGASMASRAPPRHSRRSTNPPLLCRRRKDRWPSRRPKCSRRHPSSPTSA